jgi:flagellar biosynthetic protein FlhB
MQRTEPPTPKRIRDAQARGEHAASAWLTAGLVTVGLASLEPWLRTSVSHAVTQYVLGPPAHSARTMLAERCKELARRSEGSVASWADELQAAALAAGKASLAPLAVVCALALFARVVQVGVRWYPAAGWNPTRVVSGVTAPWSVLRPHAVAEAWIREGLGVLLVGLVAAHALLDAYAGWTSWALGTPAEALERLSRGTAIMLQRVGLVMLAIGGVDFLYQRWKYARRLAMTRQEIQQELRETEGNPAIRHAQQQAMRAPYAPQDDEHA